MSVLYAPSMAWNTLLVGLTIPCSFLSSRCSITGAGNYPKSFFEEMFSVSFFFLGGDGVVGYGLDYGFSHIEMDFKKNRN